MVGGLLNLVTNTGPEDHVLTATPQVTPFKCIYRRYCNFSCEQISTPVSGDGFGSIYEAQLHRDGDLLGPQQIQFTIDPLEMVSPSVSISGVYAAITDLRLSGQPSPRLSMSELLAWVDTARTGINYNARMYRQCADQLGQLTTLTSDSQSWLQSASLQSQRMCSDDESIPFTHTVMAVIGAAMIDDDMFSADQTTAMTVLMSALTTDMLDRWNTIESSTVPGEDLSSTTAMTTTMASQRSFITADRIASLMTAYLHNRILRGAAYDFTVTEAVRAFTDRCALTHTTVTELLALATAQVPPIGLAQFVQMCIPVPASAQGTDAHRAYQTIIGAAGADTHQIELTVDRLATEVPRLPYYHMNLLMNIVQSLGTDAISTDSPTYWRCAIEIDSDAPPPVWTAYNACALEHRLLSDAIISSTMGVSHQATYTVLGGTITLGLDGPCGSSAYANLITTALSAYRQQQWTTVSESASADVINDVILRFIDPWPMITTIGTDADSTTALHPLSLPYINARFGLADSLMNTSTTDSGTAPPTVVYLNAMLLYISDRFYHVCCDGFSAIINDALMSTTTIGQWIRDHLDSVLLTTRASIGACICAPSLLPMLVSGLDDADATATSTSQAPALLLVYTFIKPIDQNHGIIDSDALLQVWLTAVDTIVDSLTTSASASTTDDDALDTMTVIADCRQQIVATLLTIAQMYTCHHTIAMDTNRPTSSDADIDIYSTVDRLATVYTGMHSDHLRSYTDAYRALLFDTTAITAHVGTCTGEQVRACVAHLCTVAGADPCADVADVANAVIHWLSISGAATATPILTAYITDTLQPVLDMIDTAVTYYDNNRQMLAITTLTQPLPHTPAIIGSSPAVTVLLPPTLTMIVNHYQEQIQQRCSSSGGDADILSDFSDSVHMRFCTAGDLLIELVSAVDARSPPWFTDADTTSSTGTATPSLQMELYIGFLTSVAAVPDTAHSTTIAYLQCLMHRIPDGCQCNYDSDHRPLTRHTSGCGSGTWTDVLMRLTAGTAQVVDVITALTDRAQRLTETATALTTIASEMQLTSTTDTFKYAWCQRLGHHMFEWIEICIDGDTFDRQSGDLLDVLYELNGSSTSDRAYAQLIADDPDVWTPGQQPKRRLQLSVPLRFWYCTQPGWYLPLVAMQYSTITLRFKLRNFTDCIVHTATGHLRGAQPYSVRRDERSGKIRSSGPPRITCSVQSEYVYLDTNERAFMARNRHEYLYRYMQYGGTTVIDATTTNRDTATIRTLFHNPCSAMLVSTRMRSMLQAHRYSAGGFRPCSCLRFAQTTYPECPMCNGRAQTGSLDRGLIINNMTVMFNGVTRQETQSGSYYAYANTLRGGWVRSPRDGIYSWNVALTPASHQPSGVVNMSRIDTTSLVINIDPAAQALITDSGDGVEIQVWAITYGVIRCMSGMIGRLFQY